MQLLRLSTGERRYGDSPFPVLVRNHWEFQAILAGHARTCPNDRGANHQLPRLYVSGPQSAHGWTDEPRGVSKILVMDFSQVPEALQSLVPVHGGIAITLTPDSLRTLTFVSSHLEPHYRRPCPSTEVAVKAALYLLLEIILNTAAFRESHGTHRDIYQREKVRQALHYYDQNIWQDPSVDAVAEAIGLSASQMRRIFRSAHGISPHQALQSRRMELAASLLRCGQSVSSVADALGFSEVSAFSRAYRKWSGQPPGTHCRPV